MKHDSIHRFLRSHLNELIESGSGDSAKMMDMALTLAFGVVLSLNDGDKVSSLEFVKDYFEHCSRGILNGDIEPPYLKSQTIQ